MNSESSETKQCKADIIKRLNRIEGQVKGIQKMIESDKQCIDIITQVAAVRAAINKVGGIILENYSMTCVKDIVSADDKEEALQNLTRTVQSFIRFVD